MKEKIKKYVDLIPRGSDFNLWKIAVENNKLAVKNVFSCLVEKGVELEGYEQMQEIRMGIEDGLTSSQIMLYAESKVPVNRWRYIRKALVRGVPIEVLKPVVKVPFSYEQLSDVEKKYFNEKHEEDKKAFIDRLFSDEK